MDIDLILDPALSRRGPSQIAGRLAETINSPETPCRIFTAVNKWSGIGLDCEVLAGIPTPGPLSRIPTRFMRGLGMARAERLLLQRIRTNTGAHVVFTFGNVSLEVSRKLHALGVTVVREKFNCARATARTILDRAYERLGEPPAHGLDDEFIAYENEGLKIADAIFCPSPQVTKSLRALGISPDRLIETSYGWTPARFSGARQKVDGYDGSTLLFVGYLCVRKGAHILLDAWQRAAIKGRLIIAGDIEPLIRRRYRHVLDRSDVVHFSYTDDVPALFKASDWFVFPSLEEGGPLVTYEAAGCGVPALVSPMGAGAFVRDQVDGIVIDDHDADVWAQAIASLPSRRDERRAMADSAAARALEFTWDKVGARRRQDLQRRFSSASSAISKAVND